MTDLNYPSPKSPQSAEKRKPPPTWLAVAAVAFLLFFGGGVYLAIRVSQIDSRLAQIDQGLTRTVEIVRQLSDKTDAASRRADQAEQYSQLAAEGRAKAESALVEAEKEAEGARVEAQTAKKEAEQIRRERDEELGRLEASLSRIAETRRTALGLVMNLGSDALQFDFDKADLRPENRELLSRILGVLLTLEKGYAVYVYGHTDDVGSDQYNLELSQRRAESVRDYLVEGGVNPSIISTEGFGKRRPLVPGTSPEARAKNRRVEIGIIHTDIHYTGTPPKESSPN